MKVDHYLLDTFPGYVPNSQDRDMMAGMNLYSPCGEACRRAIDNARAMRDSIREAHGEGSRLEMALAGITVDILGTFICG